MSLNPAKLSSLKDKHDAQESLGSVAPAKKAKKAVKKPTVKKAAPKRKR